MLSDAFAGEPKLENTDRMPIPTPTLDVNGRYPFESEFVRKEELKGTRFGRVRRLVGDGTSGNMFGLSAGVRTQVAAASSTTSISPRSRTHGEIPTGESGTTTMYLMQYHHPKDVRQQQKADGGRASTSCSMTRTPGSTQRRMISGSLSRKRS